MSAGPAQLRPVAPGAALGRPLLRRSQLAFSTGALTSSRDARHQLIGASGPRRRLPTNPLRWESATHGLHTPKASAAAGAPSADGSPAANDKKTALLRVVLPTAVALMLCNMDRICMSVAILPMSQELGWAPSVQGVIQSSFLWGYTATQLIGGTLADRLGGKAVLGAGVLWFSFASLLMPLALSDAVRAAGLTLPAVLFARSMVGLGEGVALPSMSNLVATAVPRDMRATALGGSFTGFHLGNLVGLVLSPLVIAAVGWKNLFVAFGLLGLPLLAFWNAVVVAPPPRPAPAAPDAAAPPATVSVARLIASPRTWAIVIANCVNHWGYFLFLNWLPAYFFRTLGLDLKASSLMSFLPWLAMAIGSSAAGVLADGLVSRGMDATTVRKGVQAVAFAVPAAALLALNAAGPSIAPAAAVGLFVVVLGAQSLGQAGFVANMSDIAPTAAGKMFGLCNTFGSLSGVASAIVAGKILAATGSFHAVFQLTAALYVLGAAVWVALCSAERQF